MNIKRYHQVGSFNFEEVTVMYKELELSILNYGATVTSLKVPNKEGILENIVLSYVNLEDYIQNASCLNAIIGPTSGRIKDAVIHLNNETIKLDKNFQDKHHLHGGQECFAFQLFDVTVIEQLTYTDVICSLDIKDEHSFYPGNKQITITYRVEPSKVTIMFDALSDQDTYMNMTSHLYFNLSGEKQDIKDQHLMIDADKMIALDEEFIPTEIVSVKKANLDVNTPRKIASLLTKDLTSSHIKGIDHPFILNKTKPYAASLFDPVSQRLLRIKTTYPVIVCYTHNYPEDKLLTNNTKNIPHQGICFETQYTPNPEEFQELTQSILRANQPYHQETEYVFSIKKES